MESGSQSDMNEEQEILMNEEISAVTGGWPWSAPEAAAGSSPGLLSRS